ncbi:MAG: Trm112 family protein [Candidatus Helarchaeota archaeon]
MKLGLLDLLACPICKHWPIRLQVFSWETPDETFKKAIEGLKDIKILKNLTKIVRKKDKAEDCVIIKDDTIQDDLVRYQLKFKEYIDKAVEILKNLEYIEILTEGYPKDIHNKVIDIYNNFLNVVNITDENKVKNFIEGQITNIYLLNWYFQRAEIQDGIMICDNCKRWYPISEAIPQMLPDNLRVKKDEIKFLNKWKDLISKEVLEEGRPFNLRHE